MDLGVLRHPLCGAPPTHPRGDRHEHDGESDARPHHHQTDTLEPQQMAEKQSQQDGQDEPEGEDDVAGRDDVCHEGGEVVGEGLVEIGLHRRVVVLASVKSVGGGEVDHAATGGVAGDTGGYDGRQMIV